MAVPAERLPTFDELYAALEALPPGLTGEILGPGVLRAMGRPGHKHRLSSHRIRRSLGSSDLVDGGAGWWFEVEAEIRFGERLYVPDLAGWRIDEEPVFIEENPILVRPDWVCEILSRSTQRGDRVEKLPVYAASGVEYAWVVDPQAETVEVYGLARGQYALLVAGHRTDLAVLPPFPDPIELTSWWSVGPRGTRDHRHRQG